MPVSTINPLFKKLGVDMQGLMGKQQGYIGGMSNVDTSNMSNVMNQLMGFQNQSQANPFIQQLENFNYGMSPDVRSSMMGIANQPFSGTAGTTMEQMLSTGMPTDVSGIGDAALLRSNTAFDQLGGQAMERAAMGGGLASSGIQNKMANISGMLSNEAFAKMFEAGVGAEESARGRQMGAMGQFLQGQGLAGTMAGQVGGLEQGAAGLNLNALLGGGTLANQTDQTQLQAMLGAGGLAGNIDQMGFAGKQSQMGGGQDFLNMLLAGGGGTFGSSMLAPHEMADYITATGNAQNRVDASGQRMSGNVSNMLMRNNPYFQNPTNAPASTAPAGGGGGVQLPASGLADLLAGTRFGSRGGIGGGGGTGKPGTVMGPGAGTQMGPSSAGLSSPAEFRAGAEAKEAEWAAQRESVAAGGTPYQAGPGSNVQDIPMTPWGQQIPQGVVNWGGQ